MSLGVLSAGVGDDNQVVFEVNADLVRTWQELKRSGSARWATHDVYAGKPVREFLGPGLDKITLLIRLDAERGVVPLDEVNKIRGFMSSGAVLQFTIGGQLVGDFSVDLSDDEWRRVSREGALTTAIISITLEEYN